jgi:hypothetical protein
MNVSTWISAIGGAIVGAFVWGGIAYLTNYEVGYVAWGIGALVGGLARFMGSRGQTAGIVCGVLALASIAGGKYLATKWTIRAGIDESISMALTEEAYREALTDARDFAALESRDQYAEFMVSHNFTAAQTAAEVGADELESFEQHSVPGLRWIHANRPSFEQWRARESERMRALMQEFLDDDQSILEIVKENLGPIDILFAFLGVATAFQLARAGMPTAREESPAQDPPGPSA